MQVERKATALSYGKKKGDSYIFATGMGLLLTLVMVIWIMGIILVRGLGFFWPGDLTTVKLANGKTYLGEYWADEAADREEDAADAPVEQPNVQLKIGNRDVYGQDFIWLEGGDIAEIFPADDALVLERYEYGNFYGFLTAVQSGDQISADDSRGLMDSARTAFAAARENKERIVETREMLVELTEPLTRLQREISLLQISPEASTGPGSIRLQHMQKEAGQLELAIADEYAELSARLESMLQMDEQYRLTLTTAEGAEKSLKLSSVVRLFQPNQMSSFAKIRHYGGQLIEFIFDDPRESNTEGGVFPAIFGTVLMVILMSIAVVPFGILAALYLNEYAKQGAVTRFIRLSVNNLAGVPSIVFGVFGLGFFVYFIGGSIDQLFFSDKLPEPTYGTGGIFWASLTLALLTLPVVVVATEEGLLAIPRANKEGALALGSTKWQMIRKVVLPNAMPGILTGLILAISRGAGEVAPLMITGVVKLAPSLPLDAIFPFLHLDRKFMHLGFHIYDVGFQSPNVEAAKPMVYSTALLLIVIVIALNILAIYFRNHLRKKYKSSTF